MGFTVCLQTQGQPARTSSVWRESALQLRCRTGSLHLDASLDAPTLGTFYVARSGLDQGSFVLLFGVAHWKNHFNSHVSERDLQDILESHRREDNPRFGDLAGNFCLVSYDEHSQSMWVGADFWATAAPYYGEGPEGFVAANRSGIVADRTRASIDGISYLALIRNATLPSGRTLFDGVRRLTMGQALRLDARSGTVELIKLGPLYREPFRIGFPESVDRSIRVLSSAIPLSVSFPNTTVDLTAGNDTRLTAAALTTDPALSQRLRYRVTGQNTDPDVTAAQRIARILAWDLTVCPQNVLPSLNVHSLLSTAGLADGSFPLLSTANRLELEARYWTTSGYLVGSIAGELFRNWMWQPELFRMGQTTRVNFQALLKHRIRRDPSIEALRLSNGVMNVRDHDEMLLEPYVQLDALYPEALNTYKLDLMYILQLQNRIVWWPLATRLTVVLPFLWSDVTDVALRLPWLHKATRRLVTSIVEQLAPPITDIPTDRGAPFKPLGLATLRDYAAYLFSYTTDIARRHYLSPVVPTPLDVGGSVTRQGQPPLDAEWAAVISSCTRLHDDRGLVATIRDRHVSDLPTSRRNEFLTMLAVELLCRVYPGIRRQLAFN
jgi:hypothetical protein